MYMNVHQGFHQILDYSGVWPKVSVVFEDLFQKARTRIEVFQSLPDWLPQLNCQLPTETGKLKVIETSSQESIMRKKLYIQPYSEPIETKMKSMQYFGNVI